jgi:membrane associated rhomboid family serine protease
MNLPAVTKNIIIINVLLYFASVVATRWGVDLADLLGLHFFLADDFKIWQLFTYMFLHAGIEHIFFNMFAVWMFGRIMETVWGPRRFLIFYLFCGIGAGICQEITQYFTYLLGDYSKYDMVNTSTGLLPMSEYLNLWNTVGASGAVYGILLAFGMTFPNERLFLLFPPVPIKAKYMVMGYAAIELLLGIANNVGDNTAHFAHLGGMIFAYFLIRYWRNHDNRNRFDGWGSGSFGGGRGDDSRWDSRWRRYIYKVKTSGIILLKLR